MFYSDSEKSEEAAVIIKPSRMERNNSFRKKKNFFRFLFAAIVIACVLIAVNIQKIEENAYSDIYYDASEVAFANFRNVKLGNMKAGVLYRSASPINNSYGRASTADKLTSSTKIKYIINLSDDEATLAEHISKDDFDSPYYSSLYNENKVILLSMTSQFKSQEFKEKLIRGLTAIADNSGPYLIHCVEGKDRTGYVMMVIEALLGASYNEMVDDYMLTYNNYYGVTLESDAERYNTIKDENIDYMLHYIINDEKKQQNLSSIADYSNYAKSYLLSIGMDEDTINRLIHSLSA